MDAALCNHGRDWRLILLDLRCLSAPSRLWPLCIPRACPGVGSSLAFPVQPSVAFGGGLFRAAPGVQDLDLVSSLSGSLVAAFNGCIGWECRQMGERDSRQGRSAEMGKRVSSRQSEHGASLVEGDEALSVSGPGIGKRGLPDWIRGWSCCCMGNKSALDIIARFCMVQDAR